MISLTKGYVTMSDIQSTRMNAQWSDQEICDYFDTHPNVTIKQLAKMAGWSELYIKRTLMGDDFYD
jgi:hypothetical protein